MAAAMSLGAAALYQPAELFAVVEADLVVGSPRLGASPQSQWSRVWHGRIRATQPESVRAASGRSAPQRRSGARDEKMQPLRRRRVRATRLTGNLVTHKCGGGTHMRYSP